MTFQRRRSRSRRLATAMSVAVAAVALWSGGTHAQVQRSFVNPSFEQPVLPGANCWSIREDALVPGWETTEPLYTGPWTDANHGTCGGHLAAPPIDGAMQIFKNNFDAGSSREGIQWAELNAFTPSRLYQNVCMVNGERVDWRLAHRGRLGTERMTFNIGTDPSGAGSQLILDASTTTGGAGTVNSCGLGTCNLGGTTNGWADYSGNFIWNGASGEQTIGFQAVSTGTAGNYLDDIVLILRPFVEFFPAAAATAEGQAAAGVPAIRVTGTIEATFDVQVQITGGTASLGSDFTAPGATFSVTIPAGDYGTGQDFPLPLSVVDDADIEGDETVTFAIVEEPTDYTVGSTSTCGGPANADITWTLADNDVALSITKDDGTATYVPGFDVSYTIVVANDGPAAVSGALVDDPLPAGIATASWTCGDAVNGGVCGAASGTGAIDTTADLPAGASVTYTMSLLVPPDFTGNLVNTATVAAPAGFIEADTSDNTASDTDTMEPPPTSGACSPRQIAQGASFTLAPLPFTGTVQKSAGEGWQADFPWATLGGNYTITWTFSAPVPANSIRFAVVDVNDTSGTGQYAANPPVFAVTLGVGGTATLSDFSLIPPQWPGGTLVWDASSGALRHDPAGEYRQHGFMQGTSDATITSITITANGPTLSDNISNWLFVRPPCLTVQKVSEEGAGSFTVDMTNVANADGTSAPSTTLTTSQPGTPVSSPEYFSPVPGSDLTLSEVVPAGWDLEAAICTDQNAGNTGNPPVIGNFSSPTVTIPAANVRPEADIRCLFTNRLLPVADLAIVKTASDDQTTTGEDVSYTLQVTNNGPAAADGAALTDPQPAGLDCSTGTLTCGSETGGAVCPASPAIPDLQGAGVIVPTLPAGGSLEFTLTCTVTASGAP